MAEPCERCQFILALFAGDQSLQKLGFLFLAAGMGALLDHREPLSSGLGVGGGDRGALSGLSQSWLEKMERREVGSGQRRPLESLTCYSDCYVDVHFARENSHSFHHILDRAVTFRGQNHPRGPFTLPLASVLISKLG